MKRTRPTVDLEARARTLRAVEPTVRALVDAHLAKRRLWFPNQLLEEEASFDGTLVDRARELPDPLRVSLAVNLLTEEGLPHFHRLLATAFGEESPWQRWNFVWTAEEDRHGCVIRDYVRDARLFDQTRLERLQHAYVESGFTPEWAEDPYKVLVYVTLQERATWMAHRNVGHQAGTIEPLLGRILGRVAAEEARHHVFYRDAFHAILAKDPRGGLEAVAFILPAIEMPGVAMPGFRDMAEVAWRAGVYGPRDYLAIVEEVVDAWDIAGLDGLDEPSRKAQQAILAIPARLERIATYRESRSPRPASRFGFLHADRVDSD